MRLGTLLLSLLIALMLWGMAHGTASIDRGFDVPVVFDGIPDHLHSCQQTFAMLTSNHFSQMRKMIYYHIW